MLYYTFLIVILFKGQLKVGIYNGNKILKKHYRSRANRNLQIDFITNKSAEYRLEIINISGDQSNAEYDLKIKSILHLVENTKQIAKRETNSKTLYNLWLSSLENDDAINAFLDFHEEKTYH